MIKKAPAGSFWVYMVQCKFGTFYTGYTHDLKRRMAAHNEGKGAKYLRGKGPVTLIYKKKFKTAKEAMAQERLIKSLTRIKKEALIKKTPLRGL